MGTSFVENLPKSCFLFALLPTKLLATSTRFIASVLQILDLFDLTLANVYVYAFEAHLPSTQQMSNSVKGWEIIKGTFSISIQD